MTAAVFGGSRLGGALDNLGGARPLPLVFGYFFLTTASSELFDLKFESSSESSSFDS